MDEAASTESVCLGARGKVAAPAIVSSRGSGRHIFKRGFRSLLNRRSQDVIERVAGTLDTLARELRALTDRGLADQSPDPSDIGQRLDHFWRGVTLDSRLTVGRCTIDLQTASGKWELLVLAILRGARVREHVVVRTFVALKERGLLARERVLQGDERTKTHVMEVFDKEYRALGNKAAKVEAIFWNCAHLQERWSGDLDQLYRAAAGDGEALIQYMTQFKQIGRMALWMCRTLEAHGVWVDVPPEASRYMDRFVATPLRRLGFAPTDDVFDHQSIQKVLAKHFAGRLLSLFLHGKIMCSQDDVETCKAECPVASRCHFPQSALSRGQDPSS